MDGDRGRICLHRAAEYGFDGNRCAGNPRPGAGRRCGGACAGTLAGGRTHACAHAGAVCAHCPAGAGSFGCDLARRGRCARFNRFGRTGCSVGCDHKRGNFRQLCGGRGWNVHHRNAGGLVRTGRQRGDACLFGERCERGSAGGSFDWRGYHRAVAGGSPGNGGSACAQR